MLNNGILNNKECRRKLYWHSKSAFTWLILYFVGPVFPFIANAIDHFIEIVIWIVIGMIEAKVNCNANDNRNDQHDAEHR